MFLCCPFVSCPLDGDTPVSPVCWLFLTKYHSYRREVPPLWATTRNKVTEPLRTVWHSLVSSIDCPPLRVTDFICSVVSKFQDLLFSCPYRRGVLGKLCTRQSGDYREESDTPLPASERRSLHPAIRLQMASPSSCG